MRSQTEIRDWKPDEVRFKTTSQSKDEQRGCNTQPSSTDASTGLLFPLNQPCQSFSPGVTYRQALNSFWQRGLLIPMDKSSRSVMKGEYQINKEKTLVLQDVKIYILWWSPEKKSHKLKKIVAKHKTHTGIL